MSNAKSKSKEAQRGETVEIGNAMCQYFDYRNRGETVGKLKILASLSSEEARKEGASLYDFIDFLIEARHAKYRTTRRR